ncbi:MAG: secretin N-terminal domain-containing protein [Akkermansiaceae bacterium]
MRHFSKFSLLTLLLSPLLFSQEEEAPAIPGIDVVAPAENDDQPAIGNDEVDPKLIVENLEYLELSGNDLADLYRRYTGRRVIVASSAAQAEFEFIQPASKDDPLTYAQAAELLKKAATIENFIFVPDATDPNLDFLTLATAGIKPTGRGVSVYTENDQLPEGDAVISYVMSLDYIKPDEAVRTFTQIIGQFGAFGSIAAVPNAASVVITENTSLIRKLIELKAEIDKPSSQVATRFINVRYADVTELATTLNELLGSQEESSRTAGIQRAPQNRNQPAISANNVAITVEGQGGGSGEQTPVQIIPDARTNRIFAMGRPVDLLFVEGLVREFDTESDQRNFLRRKLQFLAVADFLPIAGDALTRAFNGTGSADTVGANAQGNGRQNNNRQQTNNFGNNRNGNQSNFGGGGTGNNSGSRGNVLSDPDVNSAPESLLIGRTLLVADNITNSIVVQGPPSGVEIIEKLLDQVDVKADQVMISTVFGQLALQDDVTTGVDWLHAFRGDSNGLAFSNITGAPANGRLPQSITDPITGLVAGTFPNQSGLSLYGKIGSNLAAYVNLISTSDQFTVLSRPSVFTANNQKGTISSGRRIAIPTNSNQFSGGGVSTNIEYRDVVLKLEVIPLVNSENEITLQLALLSDDIIGETAIEGIGQVPIIGTRELLTTVTVPNNQTIVLGGLITTNDTESVTGIPLLSDIPGLGRLFSTKSDGVQRDELMIFIQPSIVNDSNSLDYVQTDMDSRFTITEPTRQMADGNVLPPLDVEPGKGSSPNATAVKTESNNRNRKPMRPPHKR